MRERGLKHHGAHKRSTLLQSLPVWERGLKLLILEVVYTLIPVASHVGAWIETKISQHEEAAAIVAPHVGAWIETGLVNMR